MALLARDYIAEALVARMDAPNREDYQNAADHEKAWKAWVHRTRKIDHGMRKIVKKYKPTS